MKCFRASFNVENVEVWCTELYRDKKNVLLEIDKSKDEILERIDCFSMSASKEELGGLWDEVILDIKKHEKYENKINRFDFFILEHAIL
jgi:hypothetical protein